MISHERWLCSGKRMWKRNPAKTRYVFSLLESGTSMKTLILPYSILPFRLMPSSFPFISTQLCVSVYNILRFETKRNLCSDISKLLKDFLVCGSEDASKFSSSKTSVKGALKWFDQMLWRTWSTVDAFLRLVERSFKATYWELDILRESAHGS